MFSLVTGLYETYWAPPQLNILLVGAPSTGKTALLERLRVTHFSKKNSTTTTVPTTSQLPPLPASWLPQEEKEEAKTVPKSSTTNKPSTTSTPKATSPPKRRLWACPAPSRYSKQEDEDDEEEVVIEEEPAPQPQAADQPEKEEPEPADPSKDDDDNLPVSLEDLPQLDVKPNAKMMSLQKLRPTIGMNLRKLTIQGAVCHFWDLGGKMHDLWERYYGDSDAVIFVYHKPATAQAALAQLVLLNQVRASIPASVPFVILGHVFSDNTSSKANDGAPPPMNVRYSTAQLWSLPPPKQACEWEGFFFVNAATGEGVRHALEWLVPWAKQQFRVRQRSLTAETVEDRMEEEESEELKK